MKWPWVREEAERLGRRDLADQARDAIDKAGRQLYERIARQAEALDATLSKVEAMPSSLALRVQEAESQAAEALRAEREARAEIERYSRGGEAAMKMVGDLRAENAILRSELGRLRLERDDSWKSRATDLAHAYLALAEACKASRSLAVRVCLDRLREQHDKAREVWLQAKEDEREADEAAQVARLDPHA